MSILTKPRNKRKVFKKSPLKSPNYIYEKRKNDYAEGEEFYNLYLQYNIIGGGEDAVTITINPQQNEYLPGTELTLTAVAAEGYNFTSWSANVDSPETAETTITLNADKTVTVTVTKQVELTTAVSGSGSVVVDPEQDAYDIDTVVTVTATPDEGNVFVNWTGDVSTVADPNSASTTITLDADKSVTANFTAE